jgi:glutaconate CoA-transferase subunit A
MGKLARRVELEALVSEHVDAGCSLALGGLHFHNTPMAAVRELIRQSVAIGRLIPPVDGSINADQLIGAGLVEEIHTAYVGLEHFGMAPRFRAAAESGALRVRETEEAGFMLGLQAAATGLPFVVLPEGFFPPPGSEPTVPDVNRVDYREIEDPFTGRRHHAARAVKPDVAIVHCQAIDARGNGGFLGAAFFDVEVARAADRCLVVAERQSDELPSECTAHLPGFLVDAYCVLEGGAHPASSHGLYRFDAEHIRAYAEQARTDEGFAGYRERTIGRSEAEYRQAAGVEARLRELAEERAA